MVLQISRASRAKTRRMRNCVRSGRIRVEKNCGFTSLSSTGARSREIRIKQITSETLSMEEIPHQLRLMDQTLASKNEGEPA